VNRNLRTPTLDCGNPATGLGKLKAAIARNRGRAVTVKIG
jgi:hypothetical protein